MELPGQPEHYDLLILGSGAGSKLLAWTFAGKGKKVAVVERKYVGCACPNIACLPSKNVIHSAQIFHNAQEADIFENDAAKALRIDMAAVTERKRRMVAGLVDAHLALYKQSGAELIMASGKFVGPKTLEAISQD